MTSVALLGAGLLGNAIARRFLDQGLSVRVWNRNPDRIASLLKQGASPITELEGAARGCDAVVTVLRDGPVTSQVVSSLGELNNTTVIPMGTMGVGESRELAEQVLQQNGRYLEAPVLGSRPQALNGTLLVMAGGEYSGELLRARA